MGSRFIVYPMFGAAPMGLPSSSTAWHMKYQRSLPHL